MLWPKCYIFNKESLQDYKCSQCFEVDYELLACQGPCQKRICKSCFQLYEDGKMCRFCQNQMKGLYLPPNRVQFYCPAQGCSAIMRSERQFDHHCTACLHLSNQFRTQFIYKRSFRCEKGHLLDNQLEYGACSVCLSVNLLTAQCQTCGTQYCTNCRPFPCSKKECSIGHKFEKIRDTRRQLICDLCGISIGRLDNKVVFCDRQCDFDVCLACHRKLQKEHPLPSYRFKMKEQFQSLSDEEEFNEMEAQDNE